jgi:hypothetical protein
LAYPVAQRFLSGFMPINMAVFESSARAVTVGGKSEPELTRIRGIGLITNLVGTPFR